MINFKKSLELQNINFGYSEKNLIFDNINFEINKGKNMYNWTIWIW